MKLTDSQIAQIKDQMGADPVPSDSPTTELLAGHFGEHTFYVDEAALRIFETEQSEVPSGPCDVHPVRVASWTSEKRDSLAPTNPWWAPRRQPSTQRNSPDQKPLAHAPFLPEPHADMALRTNRLSVSRPQDPGAAEFSILQQTKGVKLGVYSNHHRQPN